MRDEPELRRPRTATQSSVDTLAVLDTPPAPQLAVAYRTLSCEDRVFLRTLDELDKKVSVEQESIHRLDAPFAIERLKSHPYLGLSDKEASRRLKEFGLNAISPPKVNLWLKYGSYFFGGFCWILWIASLAVFLSWSTVYLNVCLWSDSNFNPQSHLANRTQM